MPGVLCAGPAFTVKAHPHRAEGHEIRAADDGRAAFDAEAFEIAQPDPSNFTSAMRSPSIFSHSVSWSPQSGLWPTSW